MYTILTSVLNSHYHRRDVAPLRSSDRRKLKQRVLQAYPVLQPEEGDLLVPDGLQSQKFSTHLEDPGVCVQISISGLLFS